MTDSDSTFSINEKLDCNGDKIPINPCFVCGKSDFEMMDTLYPANRERTEWECGCAVHNGGCGRQVYGSSKQDVIERWNNNKVDEYIY